MERMNKIIVKAFIIGSRTIDMTGQRQVVLIFTGNLPFFNHYLTVLAHGKMGPRLTDIWNDGFKALKPYTANYLEFSKIVLALFRSRRTNCMGRETSIGRSL